MRSLNSFDDILAMEAVVDTHPSEHLHHIDLPYRFSSWALDEPKNVALWEDNDGTLRAWSVLQTPFWTIDYGCSPNDAALFQEILAWAEDRARQILDTPYGHPKWFVVAFSRQTAYINDLKKAGFWDQSNLGEDSWTKILLRRPGELPVPNFRVPANFTLRPLAGADEVSAYVDLHRETFETRNMTVEWRNRTLAHPAYNSSLDIVGVAPDGHLGAFCIGWLRGKAAHVEPLGCHADFRRYALGRLALAECLRQMQKAGAEEIFVETDGYRDTAFQLYQSLGFEIIEDVLVFGKGF